MPKRKKISEVTVLDGENEDNPIVVRYKMDSDGNTVIGVELGDVIDKMNLDIILAQPIIDRYESMFAELIFKEGTKDIWQHAFFDVYLFALAHEAKKGEEKDE